MTLVARLARLVIDQNKMEKHTQNKCSRILEESLSKGITKYHEVPCKVCRPDDFENYFSVNKWLQNDKTQMSYYLKSI